MDYTKLLSDYINKENDNKIVISFSEHGNEIRIVYRYEGDSYTSDLTISLLDLLVFIYSTY